MWTFCILPIVLLKLSQPCIINFLPSYEAITNSSHDHDLSLWSNLNLPKDVMWRKVCKRQFSDNIWLNLRPWVRGSMMENEIWYVLKPILLHDVWYVQFKQSCNRYAIYLSILLSAPSRVRTALTILMMVPALPSPHLMSLRASLRNSPASVREPMSRLRLS